MEKMLTKLFGIMTKMFLVISIFLAVVWIAAFSGIVWTPDEVVSTLWQAVMNLAKGWAPLFVPVAAIVFVLKNFQASITYQICRALKPELELAIKDTVQRSLAEALDQKIARHTLTGIGSICRSLAKEGYESGLYKRAREDFERAIGYSNFDPAAHY